MKVGILTASISRKAGGLFWSVRALAQGLQATGCKVKVFASGDAYTERDQSHWSNLDITVFPQMGPAGFGYMPELMSALQITGLDVMHIHGLWMYSSIATMRLSKRTGKPYLVSPRGMLDPWAVNNSAWKKRLAAWLYENAHLRGAACLHALCDAEARAMRAYGLINPICVIPNGVEIPALDSDLGEPPWANGLPRNAKVMFYLGRLHPKKGLSELLHAWAVSKAGVSGDQWYLVIAGWDQGGHEAELKRLGRELGIIDHVRFVGPQFDSNKAVSLARADAFILPSFSEGLPMAILEAWSYSLPVLMTPQCNLPEGFQAGAAIDINPDTESIAAGMLELFNMSDLDRQAMGDKGYQLVKEKFSWQRAALDMCSVYQWVLGKALMPDYVFTE